MSGPLLSKSIREVNGDTTHWASDGGKSWYFVGRERPAPPEPEPPQTLDELRAELADIEEAIDGLEDLHEEYGAEYGDRLMEALNDRHDLEQKIAASIPPDRKGSQ